MIDGNPFYLHPGVLWETAQNEKITVFVTSDSYLTTFQKAGFRIGEEYDLSALRAVLSKGSPLSEEGFEFAYEEIKKDIQYLPFQGERI